MPKKTFYFTPDPARPVTVDADIVDDWMDAAERRDVSGFFQEVDQLLKENKYRHPLRVFQLRQNLAWLVEQADRKGLRW